MSHGHNHDDDLPVRVEALETLLVEKRLVDPAAVDEIIRHYEQDVGPMNGARVVARAWVDPAYKARLLADGTAAVAELGYAGREGASCTCGREPTGGAQRRRLQPVLLLSLVAARPPTELVQVAGLPLAGRARAARGHCRDGPRPAAGHRVRVWDSSAEVRYLVLPERPPDTDGLPESELTGLVSRDAMIGVSLAGRRDAPHG